MPVEHVDHGNIASNYSHGPVSSTPKRKVSVDNNNRGTKATTRETENQQEKDATFMLQLEKSFDVTFEGDASIVSRDNTFLTANPNSSSPRNINSSSTDEIPHTSTTEEGNNSSGKMEVEGNTSSTGSEILQAIKNLQSSMNRMEGELQAMKTQESENKKQIEELKQRVEKDQTEKAKEEEVMKKNQDTLQKVETSCTRSNTRANLESLEARVENNEARMEHLVNLFAYQALILKECKEKFEILESQKNRCNLIIQGLEVKADETPQQAAKAFFRDIMKISQDLQIQKAYKKDKFNNIVVKFKDPGVKKIVFENVKNLKGVKNGQDKFYSVDNQNSAKQQEQRRRNKEIVKLNKNLTVAQRLSLTIKQGILKEEKIEDGETKMADYEGNIKCPSHTEAMMLTQEELNELEQKFNTSPGQRVTVGSSTLRGYVYDVNNFEEVNQIYQMVRYKHLDARHVVCAAILGEPETLFTEGFEDDEEYGCGRILL